MLLETAATDDDDDNDANADDGDGDGDVIDASVLQ